MQHIQHKTIIITGAGSGLGRAMALHFASKGFAVAVTDINLDSSQSTLQSADFPAGSFAFELDTTNEQQWQQLHEKITREWSGLGVIVNNAGVASAGLLEEESQERWEWMFNINVFGVVRGCRQFLRLMKQQNSGHIVNIASFAAIAGAPSMSSYSASKAAVYSLSECLYNENAATEIGVTVACPAFIRTNLLDSMQHSDPSHVKRAKRWMETSGYTVEDFAQAIYQAVDNKQFLLLLHKKSKWLWRLKRLAPGAYYQLLQKQVKQAARRR